MDIMTEQHLRYLQGLNGPQKEGVLATEGPVLVIAGAGSGKTKMLTTRIVHLIEGCGVPPENILAVTFTNKAAGEMRERVAHALGHTPESWKPVPFWAEGFAGRHSSAQPMIGTFHSVCIRILRRELARLPFTAQFNVMDDSDQLSLVKECFNKLNLSDKMFSPKNFQYAINEAKCAAKEPADIDASEFDVFTKNLAKLYAMYQQEMYKANSIDFGEIITAVYKLFRDNPDVLARYQQLFRYIHVDEYQDTNRAQYLVVNQLAALHKNLCVVGDEDQSIYRWRGADIKNILDFEQDYTQARVIKLEQNYRSTQTIINASSDLIAHNTTRKVKRLWTDNEPGANIQRIQTPDDHSEASFVVRRLKEHCGEDGFSFRDVAVFYRTNAQSRIFEDVLRREKVPYNIIGALKFYDRKEIKDVLAYLRALLNPTDSVSLKRIINVPGRGIGKTTVEKVEAIQFQQGLTFFDAIELAISNGTLTGAAAKKVGDFRRMIVALRGLAPTMSLTEFYHEVLDRTGYVQELKLENTEEARARVDNLQEFDSIIAEFEASQRQFMEGREHPRAGELLTAFLESVTLASTTDEEQDAAAGLVSLMTLHTSKGLEFPLVFMVGCEEGLFPSIRHDEEPDPDDIEEERRLCYVGMTRAKQLLYMSHAVSRRVYGNILFQDPSRFFNEIPAKYMDYHDLAPGARRFNADDWGSSEDDAPRYVRDDAPVVAGSGGALAGKAVKHPNYGPGVIKASEGSGMDVKVTVDFKHVGVKKFILRFAQLEFLD